MTLFPSDLRGSPARAERVELAGRVIDYGERRLVVADAFAALDAELLTSVLLEVGDLVVLSGAWSGTCFVVEGVVQRHSAPLPRGDGDVARFVFQGVGSRLASRAAVLSAIRGYFARERFIEVETPLAVPAPGVDRNVEAVAAAPGWFITSPELEMKRLIVGGVPRQYQLARVRRREESGALHEEEFTLLEWYRAFAGQEAVMRDTEALVSEAARAVRGRAELVAPDGRLIDAAPPFERVSVAEAFQRHAGIADVSELAAADAERYFELLIERVEPALAAYDRPVFLLNYPISEAALARPCPHDARYAERFELYAGGVELCNGYGELTDPVEQRRRCEEEAALRQRSGRTVYPINERFLAALEAGMPPSGGNALGVDRLVMLACGARTIQEVLAFPQSQL